MRGALIARCIRLCFNTPYPAVPGSNPKHTIYAFHNFIDSMYFFH